MDRLRFERWWLFILIFDLIAGVAHTIVLSRFVPTILPLAMLEPVLVLLLGCVACSVGGLLGRNGRGKVFLGLLFNWMFVGAVVTRGIDRLYGLWWQSACYLTPTAILAVVAIVLRAWLWQGLDEQAK